jgi:hypothetical protein
MNSSATSWVSSNIFAPSSVDIGDVTIADDAVARIEELSELEDGWDSYRASAPSQRAIALALRLVRACAADLADCRVELGASIDGGVAFSIERGGRWVDITLNNDRSVRVERSDDLDEIVSFPDLETHIRWLSQA